MKTVFTIAGIRPDLIRLKFLIERLDANPKINHVFIHTGQHFDPEVTTDIYKDIDLRKPDIVLDMGQPGRQYYEQISNLFLKLVPIIRRLHPDLVITLGDTNSVLSNYVLKIEAIDKGFKIARIEAGLYTNSFVLPEEVNRTIANSLADYHFAYTEGNKENLIKRNINKDGIFVVGNTIVEPLEYILNKYNISRKESKERFILADIHRKENLSPNRLAWVLEKLTELQKQTQCSVKILCYNTFLNEFGGRKNDYDFEYISLQKYSDFIKLICESTYIYSDSGSMIEEAAFLDKKLFVPREVTERPEAVDNSCCYHITKNKMDVRSGLNFFKMRRNISKSWLGDGKTSNHIMYHINNILGT